MPCRKRVLVPAGVSEKTLVMLEKMKRKVAKRAATSLTVAESRQVDVEIDEALARLGGSLVVEQFKARLGRLGEGTVPGTVNKEQPLGSPEQPDLIQRGPATAEGDCGGISDG